MPKARVISHATPIVIEESMKTTSMETVSTGMLDKNKEY